jgi:hypothetical protein
VLLVTTGNPNLKSALRSLPGIALTVARPDHYRASTDFDAYVFDRFAPLEPPTRGALLFRPPSVYWLPAFGRSSAHPLITRWDETNRLASDVNWRDVQVQDGMLTRHIDSQQDVVLAKGLGEGALVAAGGKTPRWLAVGFALDDSNFAMQAGFTVFLANAIDWLAGSVPIRSYGLGQIEIPEAGGRVTGLDGRAVVTVNVPGATIFEARRPDVYTVASSQGTTQVIANVIDPHYSDVNRSRFAAAPARSARTAPSPHVGFEPWIALLVLALGLLSVEWLTYTRRGTI